MAEVIKYVSFDNLAHYDELIKKYIDGKVDVFDNKLNDTFKAVALDGDKLQFFTKAPVEGEDAPAPAFEITLPKDSAEEITKLQEKMQELEDKFGDLGENETVADAIEAALEKATEDVARQIANALGSVFTYKGAVDTENDLHELGEAKVGDVWIVKEDNSEYIYTVDEDGGHWEKFGSTIDLSGYATTQALTDERLRAANAENALRERITTLENDKLDLEPISNEEIDQLFDGTPTDEEEATD